MFDVELLCRLMYNRIQVKATRNLYIQIFIFTIKLARHYYTNLQMVDTGLFSRSSLSTPVAFIPKGFAEKFKKINKNLKPSGLVVLPFAY